jgi:hypothetical protein
LIASLHPLEPRHQFQIIFYNERPVAMSLARGDLVQMTLADERGKRLAEQFSAAFLPMAQRSICRRWSWHCGCVRM